MAAAYTWSGDSAGISLATPVSRSAGDDPAEMEFGSPDVDPRHCQHHRHQEQPHPQHRQHQHQEHDGPRGRSKQPQRRHRDEPDPTFSPPPPPPQPSPTTDEIEQLKDHCDSIGREIRRYDKAVRSDEAVPAQAGSGFFKSQTVIETIATIVHENGLPDRVKHLALEIFERSCQRLLKQGHIKKLDMLQDVLVATSLASKWINSSKNLKCAVQVRLLQLHSHHRASKATVLERELQMFETLDYSIPPSIHCTIEGLVTILAANAEVQQIDIEREALDRLINPLLMVTADLAKTLQAKAGTQGAFMLRCCGIVAAASRILNSDIGNEVVAILSAISRVPPEDIATYAGEITAHVGPEF